MRKSIKGSLEVKWSLNKKFLWILQFDFAVNLMRVVQLREQIGVE